MGKTGKRMSMRVFAWLCLLWLIMLPAAHAAVPEVSPDEGTVGTVFTITGAAFGAKTGKVFMGSQSCNVLKWSDTSIECKIRKPLPTGEYDLLIRPKGGENVVILPNAFDIKAPKLDPPAARPNFVSPGDVITVTGAFFGEELGDRKVQIRDHEGNIKKCRIMEWTMSQITFRLPDAKKISGKFSLIITNPMGMDTQHVWGTFADAPQNPPNLLGSSYDGGETRDTASAVCYQNKYWFFWPDKDKDDNHLQYKTWDGGSTWSGTSDIVVGGETQKTKTTTCPIVANNDLYVFFTGLSGYADYVIYNPLISKEESGRWLGKYEIPGVRIMDNYGEEPSADNRFAAVYNFVNNTIEVYWASTVWPSDVHIYMKTLDLDTGEWSESKTVGITISSLNPLIAPGVDAIFNRVGDDDYVTYLSWSDQWNGYVSEVKDGVLLHQTGSHNWYPYSNNSNVPSLVDLGENQLAIIYNDDKTKVHYWKYDKVTHAAIGGEIAVPFSSDQDGGWDAEGVVVSSKVSDSNSPTKYRLDTNFYAIVENNPVADEANWELVKCEYLGYWMPTGPPNYIDFAGGDLPQAQVNERLEDTFSNWPIIGIIDMPPFVLNGNEECEDWSACGTEVDVTYSTTTTAGLSGEYSAGAYMETGKKSPVTFDASAGYAGGFENSTSFSYTQTARVEANMDGAITALYLAPSFNVYELEWYDLNGTPTDLYTQAVEVVGAVVRKEGFEPEAGPVMSTLPEPYLDPDVFPVHKSEDDRERLASYWLNPTATPYFYETIVDPAKSTTSWAIGNSGAFEWGIDKDHSVDNGGYVEIKFGAEIAKKIGFGVEGSFEILVNTTTQYGVEANTNLLNQEPADDDPTRITEFSVEGYWLKPNANAYWVPEYRKGLGDAPWFLTYRVTDFWTIGDE